MQRFLRLLMVFLFCFALGSCKDVRLGVDGVDAGGGHGGAGNMSGSTGNTGGVTGTAGTSGTARCPAGQTLCTACGNGFCAAVCPTVNCLVDAGSPGGRGGNSAPSTGGATSAGGATSVGGGPAATSLSQNVALQQLLAGWVVGEILVRGDEIWFDLSARCTDCQVSPVRSDIPQTHKLVVLSNGELKSFVLGGENGVGGLTVDSQQRVFAVKSGPTNPDQGVVELSALLSGTQSLQDIPLVFSTQGAAGLTIDSEGNIWTQDYRGLLKWNGTTLTAYNTSNSILPTTEISGMAVDQHGTIWVGLGLTPNGGNPTGIMKILGDSWQYIPYSSISVLASADYASVECVDKDNNLWLSLFNWGNGPPTVRYDGTSWTAEDAGTIHCDSSGTAWNVKASFNPTPTGVPSSFDVVNSVAYWDHGTWRSVDVSGVTWGILSLDVYRTTLILGTLKGVAFVDGIGTSGTGGASGTGGTTGATDGTTSSRADAGIDAPADGVIDVRFADGPLETGLAASSCENPLPLRCGDRLNHSTLVQGRANVWVGYGVSQRWESGPETIYAFQTPTACQVVARLKNLTVDLDLFLMTGCNPGSTTQFSSTPLDLQTIETVDFTSQPGQSYFVVVDGYNGAAGTYTLEVDCTCSQDAGASDAPPADAQGDGAIAPGCDLDVASKTMATFGLITWGSPQTSNATVPAVLANDANWGIKADVCRQAGYDITALAGKTVCLLSQDIAQTCDGNPGSVSVLMNNNAVACVYKTVRPGFGAPPGLYSATDARCAPPVIPPGATVACEGGFCTNATGPCCPATNMMNRTALCWSSCPTAAMTCDGPEDCSSGTVCCSLESTAGGFAAASCVRPAECVAPSRVICHQQTDCPASQKCGVPNPAPMYIPPAPYPESGSWRVGFQVCAP